MSKRRARSTATLGFLALVPLALMSAPGAGAAERDRYIVVFEDSVEHPANLARAQVEQQNGKLGFIYRVVLNGYSAELPVQAAEGLRRSPRVKYVVVDGEVEPLTQTTPTGISRIFATANKALDIDSVDDARVDADIAVIDSGVDHAHPDLNVVARTDCSNGTEKEAKCVDASGTDVSGHGTRVAGIAAAIDNGSGVVGTAPGARIWAVKVTGTGTNYFSELIAGIEWVTAKREDGSPENDIEVANISLGCPVSAVCPTKALDEAITKSVGTGVVHVVVAGNGKEDAKNWAPANSPDVITVSALADSDGQAGGKGSGSCTDDLPVHQVWSLTDDTFAASFSNYGGTVEIAAPGNCILSTYPGSAYKKSSGTSMAAPHVAGAAAILAARDRPESKADVEAIRKTLLEEGNTGWTDTSPDGIKEPLLDVSDEAVFVPGGQYLLRNSNSAGGSADIRFIYGSSEDPVVTGDWNKDGIDSIGIYRPSYATFYLRNSNSEGGSADYIFAYGVPGDIPITGDWNNDGTDSIGIYRPSNSTFALRNSNSEGGSADISFAYGMAGDIPITGDWNNDGTDSIGIYRPSNSTFYLRNSNSEGGSADYIFAYGVPGDIPITGDWNNDGTDSIGIYRPSNSTFALRNSNSEGGSADISFAYGMAGDIPITGDWNNDGTDSIGVLR